jgi:lactate dehydrogenase-like 2-hydroxyacid dehydrogenase
MAPPCTAAKEHVVSVPSRPVVTVTRRLPSVVERALAERFDVRLNREDTPLGAAGLRAALATSDAVLCTVSDTLDADVLGVEPLRARLLANFGVGFEHVDLAAARARGISVTNTPGVLTEDTADLAVALMLMAFRRLGEGERELRAGRWPGWHPMHHLGRRLSGKTLGIVGMGRIGRAVARRAVHGFGMRLLYASRTELPAGEAAALDAVHVELDRVFAESDVVSLHVPSSGETRHLVNARRLQLMPPHGILINTSRGGVVDEAALAEALGGGTIAGAGLDVYAEEPRVHPGLLALQNVVLLPHLGSATVESRTAMGMRAFENLVAWSEGRELPDRVE